MKIVVNDQLVDYSDEGKGKHVILLLHGWGQTRHSYDAVAAHLAKRKFRVLRLDFPGFGGSPKPTSDWHIQDYAEFVQAFVQKKGIASLYAIAGHSFGGRVIIKLIANNLLQPEKVLLIDAAGVKPRDELRKVAYKVVAKTGKAALSLPGLKNYRDAMRRKLYASAGAMDFYNAGDMKKILQNTVNEDLLPFVHTITQPTLLIWGAQDTTTPVAQARAILGRLDNGRLEVIENAGHFVYDDQPETFFEKIDEFLQ